MIKPKIVKHNPAFLKQEDLVRSFVIRGVDLELLVETVWENTGPVNQHLLVIGPRGMGKTMLVLRVAAYIQDHKKLNAIWYPLVFSEESYEVFTAGEFWLHAVYHLARQEKDEKLFRIHEELRKEQDEKRLYERALACLMDFSDRVQKRLMLVVENLNMVLDDQIGPDGSWDLRHTLLNESRVMLLATAPTRFDEIENSGRAMFELFRLHHLEPLDTKDSALLWTHLTGEEVEERRIRPIQILTGGNPRLMAIISSFAAGSSFRQLMEHLTFLIDEYTTYFKSNIESLPSVERKVFVTLANIWEPATAAQVAQNARMAVNKASSLLKRLEMRGSVSVVKSSGGKKSYQVTERLYNIYHLMRLSGTQSNRVKAVVDFMVNFYEGEELAQKMAQITREACFVDPETLKDYLTLVEGVVNHVKKDEEAQKQVIEAIDPGFVKLPGVSEFMDEMTGKVDNKIDPDKFYEQFLSFEEDEFRKILEADPDNKFFHLLYGMFLSGKFKNYKKAEQAYRKAIEIDNDFYDAWHALGGLYTIQKRYDEAEKAYIKAIETDSTKPWVYAELGYLLQFHQKKYDEASQVIRIAFDKIKPLISKRGSIKYLRTLLSFFFTLIAAAGYVKEVLEILKPSIYAQEVEPLVVALQMITGEPYNAPQEVEEVAKDIVKEIEKLKS
jgi:tetratricopeptide (TPR) repeat protein